MINNTYFETQSVEALAMFIKSIDGDIYFKASVLPDWILVCHWDNTTDRHMIYRVNSSAPIGGNFGFKEDEFLTLLDYNINVSEEDEFGISLQEFWQTYTDVDAHYTVLNKSADAADVSLAKYCAEFLHCTVTAEEIEGKALILYGLAHNLKMCREVYDNLKNAKKNN